MPAQHTTRPKQRRYRRLRIQDRSGLSHRDNSLVPDVGEILREELTLIYAILNTTNALIAVTNPRGEIIRCNSACEKTTGFSFDELNGKPFSNFVLPNESARVKAVFDKLRAGHPRCEYTSHWRTRNGNLRHIAWSNAILPRSDGLIQHIICTGTDITEREQAEGNVHFQAHLLDIVDQAIVATNLDGTIIYQNRFAEQLYGWKNADIVGRNIQEITTNGSARAQELAILARVGMKKSWTDELLVHRWDETTFPALVTASPIDGEDGELLGTISISTDITEQKRAQSRLEHYIKRLENLRNIEHAILLAQSPEMVAEAALKHIRQLVPFVRGSVAVFDLETQSVRLLKVQSDVPTNLNTGAQFPLAAFGTLEQIETGGLFNIDDARFLTLPQQLRAEGMHTSVKIPLKTHDKLIGSLNLAASEGFTFTAEHIEIAQEIAEQVAIAIYNAQLFAEVKRYTSELEDRVAKRTAELSNANTLLSRQIAERELAEAAEREQRALAEALREIASTLNSTLNLEEVLERILANIARVVLHDAANIMFIESDMLRVVRCRGYHRGTLAEALFNLELSIDQLPPIQKAAQTGQAIIIPDTHQYPGWVALPGAHWVRSSVGAPISLEGQVIGFLNVDSATPGFFTPHHAERLGAFADQAAIAIQNARLYEQSQAVAALEERQRLSHELHDAISQTLWSASLIADVLPDLWEQNTEKGRQKLVRLRQLTRGALSEMRALLLELHPTALMNVPVGDLIQRLCDITTSRTGIAIVPVLEGQMILPGQAQLAIYRIAQEALNNVAHHAAATEVTVYLHCESNELMLRITDNGRGFLVDHARPGHMGIDIMRQRAQFIGASFTVNSHIGQGTEITLTWASEKE